MTRILGVSLVVVLAIVAIVASQSLYVVHQTEQALVLRFGEPKQVVREAGLHVKAPFIERVELMERRLLNLDLAAEEVIAQDKKRLVVDAFARWRIVDPLRFFQTLVNQNGANQRLRPILSSNVRRVLGEQTFFAVLSGERAQLMLSIRDGVNAQTKDLGIEIVDVRIRRADLPEQNSQAIYRRMQKEREREASEFRAQGEEISQRIRSRADREVTVLTAEATRQAEILRGEGDAEKNRIFAEAFGRDPDFFAFYRSMQAYRQALRSDDTTLLLSPDSEFFRYFGEAPRTGGR